MQINYISNRSEEFTTPNEPLERSTSPALVTASQTMWKPPFNHIDLVTKSAGAALFCNVLSQWLSTRQSELYAETLAWIMLPILFKIARRPDVNTLLRPSSSHAAQRASETSLWLVALSVATFSFFHAENGMVGFFVSNPYW